MAGISKTTRLIEFLVGRSAKSTTEEMCNASGLTAAAVERLLRDEAFLDRLERRAEQQLTADLPRVLARLSESACSGREVSAIKLFIDSALQYRRSRPATAQEARHKDGRDDVEGLMEEARRAGIDTEALRRLAFSAATLRLEQAGLKGGAKCRR